MSVRSEILLWAQRVVGTRGAAPHQLLEIAADAGLDEAQAAFHKIARTAHPDLHRASLTPEELELVTTAYARLAGAYQDLRSQRMQTARMRPIVDPGSAPGTPRSSAPTRPPPVAAAPSGRVAPPTKFPVGSEPASTPTSSSSGASGAMSSKALIYYRKAELCLRRGDIKGAVLQLKMAIAADPQSAFLRTALSEVEAEVAKKP